MKYDTSTFIEKAKKIHGDKYDYVSVNYIKSNIKVKIKCPVHGIFEQTPANHIRNNKPRGCPSCAGKNKTTKQFIGEANKIHGDKYKYSDTNYVNATTPIIISCPIHGDFKQKPSSHLCGWGCKKCGGNNKLTTNEFIIKANKIHDNRYNYSKTTYINSHTPIIITCPIHGDFKQKPNSHLNSTNCLKCVKIIHAEKRRYTTEIFVEKAKKIHGDKYDYTSVNYFKSNVKIKIKCPIHGFFTQKAYSHLAGHGCPDCNESKGELKIKQFLNKEKINYVFQKTFDNCRNKNNRKLKFDFYLPEKNVLIEFNGKQHYEPIEYFGGLNSFEKLNEYDKIKYDFAILNNIRLITIPFHKYNDICNILTHDILTNKKDYTW